MFDLGGLPGKSAFLHNTGIVDVFKAPVSSNLIVFEGKNDRFDNQKVDILHGMRISTYSFLLESNIIRNRTLQLEIEHYSFLLEFVEFFDEMKTPEIKKNMELCHHKYHLSWKKERKKSSSGPGLQTKSSECCPPCS